MPANKDQVSSPGQPVPDLKERRLAAGLSQEKLARRVDCSTSHIRLVEKGYRPSPAMAARIEAALRG